MPRANRALLLPAAGIALLASLLHPTDAPAQGREWRLCGNVLQIPERPHMEVENDDPDVTNVESDDADLVEGGISTLRGNALVKRGTRMVRADEVTYNEPAGELDADGNVHFWEVGYYLTGDQARMYIESDVAQVTESTFIIEDDHGRGTANRLEVSDRELLDARRATYTTCNPDDEVWVLDARRVEMDKLTERGVARNVVVRFKNVPIFASPFISFPLTDRRKSGFLVPSYRSSDQTGFEFEVPYYFNIAPHMDATVTPRLMTDRGVMLQGEYRYLTTRGQGKAQAQYLPNDRKAGNEYRAAAAFHHDGWIRPDTFTDVRFGWVSDEAYFSDFGTSLDVTSTTHIQRNADLVHYFADGWTAFGRVLDYQTVDPTIPDESRPYSVLPVLRLSKSTPERNRNMNLQGFAEAAHFEQDNRVTGGRLDLRPSADFPLRTAGLYALPRLSLRYTGYNLSGTAPGDPSSPDRTLPTFSLDTGAFFDRPFSMGGNDFVHTLEPRAFYLATPFTNQDDLPVFDTARYDFSFAQLFRENRYSGADRVGDANQVSLALTTRLLQRDNGTELARASVGQIYYFRDRKVTLPGEAVETTDSSDIVGELAADIHKRWRATAGIQWDPHESRTNKSSLSLRYQPDRGRVFNIAYRFVRGNFEQTDTSARWPVNVNWSVVGRWNYSIPDNRTLEAFGGVEYDSCCWAFRVVARRFLSNVLGESTNAIALQLELKGLAGIGGDTGEYLRRTIPGYQNDF